MANFFDITAGSGTHVGTDPVSIGGTTSHAQAIKNAVGKLGTFLAFQSGRLVDGTSDEAAAYVDPRPKTAWIQVPSSGLTTASTAYTTGDMLGTEMVFASASRAGAGTGQILGATLVDKAKVLGACDLFLFDRSVTPAADNAANSWSDADMLFCVGVLQFPAPFQSANNYISQSVSSATQILPLPYRCNSTSLYGYLVTRTGNTFFGAATDVVISLFTKLD